MGNWSSVNRPVTLGEMSISFDVPLSQLEGIVKRHRIDPAVRISRVRLYGPREVRMIYGQL